MAKREKLRGNIVTPRGMGVGEVLFEDTISAVTIEREGHLDQDAPMVLPGFIDLHLHGGGGADVMEGHRALETLCRYHAQMGTTSLMATTVTAPFEQLVVIITSIGEAMSPARHGQSRILGAHLEGPYISSAKLGAQPDYVQHFERSALEQLRLGTVTKIVTLAGECIAEVSDLRWLASKGVRVQLGHSAGSYEQCLTAIDAGAHGFTHLFNAMAGFHHRAPGVVGAALAHATYSELIADGIHVHPGAIQVALRSIPKLYCVSDATAAAGMPDGPFKLGSHHVHKCPNGVYLPDGTLAGSSSCLHEALLTMLDVGQSWVEAVQRVATFPADYLGATNLGRLEPGCISDIVVLHPDRTIKGVFLGGKLL